MSLERIEAEIIREATGFVFFMRVAETQQLVRVFVADDALEGDATSLDEHDLRAQLKSDLAALEAVASEKYCRGRVTADGLVTIALCDIMNFIE